MPKQEKKPLSRGLKTRQKLLECAIELISEVGYSNTTTQAIIDRSGLSRGSLLHQFRTRHELMIATGETTIDKMLVSIEARMVETGGLLEGFLKYPEILWDQLSEPPARALYEIQMASRWDKDLFDGLRLQFSKAERRIESAIYLLAREYGITDAEGYIVDLNIINDAMPNLAIRSSLSSEPTRIEAELRVLVNWHTHALTSRIAKSEAPQKSKSAPEKKTTVRKKSS